MCHNTEKYRSIVTIANCCEPAACRLSRPTSVHRGPPRPTARPVAVPRALHTVAARRGLHAQRPTAARRGIPRPAAAYRGPPRPTAAYRGPPRPTAGAGRSPPRPTGTADSSGYASGQLYIY
eukprot:3356082-Prymnesium_polylepis.2